jgi:hypothetical protein
MNNFYSKGLLKITIIFAAFFISKSAGFAQCGVVAAPDVTIACGSSTTLVAVANPVTFTMTTTACSPVATGGTNAFPVACDDCVTGEVPIGFPFTFFGTTYTTAAISSNGILGFGGLTFTGFTPFAIPSGGMPNNYIAGFFCDIDIRFGGTINYNTIGVAPNRQFVVSYNNVVPYNGGVAGTGTASFQIVINENGSFQIIISQLSANWNASTSGANATSGTENINGTQAFPVPGRNNTDWPGIVPGQLDCTTFFPVPCTFTRWLVGGTQVSTNPNYTVTPSATTTYIAEWNCSGTICTASTIVTVTAPTLTMGAVTNNTSCVSPNGSVAFSTTLSNGTYTLAYTLNGSPATTSVTVSGGAFTLANLNTSTMSNFSITTGGCSSSAAGPASITGPALLTTTGTTICQGSAGTISSASCGAIGTTIAQGATFNSGALTAADPTWNRNSGGTFCGATGGAGQYYDVFSFTVSTAGSYTLNGCFPTIDGHASLYQNAFNGANPCGTPSDFIVSNDDSAPLCGADPQLIATLSPGITYFIISTTFSTGATDTYSWTFTGPAGATIATSGAGSALEWYTASTGGSSIGSTSPFNPVGVAGSGLANTNTPGTYTYYAACPATPTCRTATTFVITPQSVAPTSISGTGAVCNGAIVTLGVVGGTLAAGSVWEWYSGSCGGTFLGNGTSIVVTPSATTTYYVRASAGSSCSATVCTSGTLTLPTAGIVLGNNTDNATCVVNQNGYIHFYHSSGRLLVSINSLGQNMGNVTVTSYIGAPVDVPSCNSASYMATAMGRHWVITPQFQPVTPINVMLHYDQSEFNTLSTAANANISPFDNLSVITDLKLSKYAGPLNVDALASNNCPGSGGSGGTTIHNQSASANITTVLPGFSATGIFSRFSIPSCSEFWLHGSTNNSALAVELISFTASCEVNSATKIRWSTASEANCSKFVVQRGDLNGNWSVLDEVYCLGSSQDIKNYEVIDAHRLPGTSFYRLIQEDIDGVETVYETISISCDYDDLTMYAFPNPAKDNFSVHVLSDKSVGTAVVELSDITGKVVDVKEVNIEKGQTLIPFDTHGLSSGSYMLTVKNMQDELKPIKIIIQK